MEIDISKLALGTVQFGIPYGIANHSGQVETEEVSKILDLAKVIGIKTLDTAVAYGESESVLGQQDISNFRLITKLPEYREEVKDIAGWARKNVEMSLARLNVSSLEGLLLHRPDQLLRANGNELYAQLESFKAEGLVKRIGISIYSPEQLKDLTERFCFDIVQAPFNVIDRRLIDSGWLSRLSELNTAVHVRSVFMQGLLLMEKSNRPEKFETWNELWSTWESYLTETEQDALSACLKFVLSVPEIEKVVIGVDSFEHLNQIASAAKGTVHPVPDEMSSNDSRLLDPSKW